MVDDSRFTIHHSRPGAGGGPQRSHGDGHILTCAARCRLAHPALELSMKRHSPRATVRLWLAAGALFFVAPLPLAAQQSVEADRALLAQERFVTPPPEV